MNHKAARLLFISALLFSMLFVASVFFTANCKNMSQTNLDCRPETEGRSPIAYVGDPVGGGIPCQCRVETQTEDRTV